MADASEIEVDSKCIKLIVRTRLDMEGEFADGKKKKSLLWSRILQKIKEENAEFKLSKEQISRKFLNLVTTYRRIKSRNMETGRNATTWEYFEDFDEIYGARYSFEPPTINVIASLDESESIDGSPNPGEELCESHEEVPPAKKARRDNQNEILKFLEEESTKEQKRHEEIMALEERKLQMEQQRINLLIQLKDVLEKTLSSNK